MPTNQITTDSTTVTTYYDAIALINTGERRDYGTAGQFLDTLDPDQLRALATALARLVPDAVRTQGVTVEWFLFDQIDQLIDAARTAGHDV